MQRGACVTHTIRFSAWPSAPRHAEPGKSEKRGDTAPVKVARYRASGRVIIDNYAMLYSRDSPITLHRLLDIVLIASLPMGSIVRERNVHRPSLPANSLCSASQVTFLAGTFAVGMLSSG